VNGQKLSKTKLNVLTEKVQAVVVVLKPQTARESQDQLDQLDPKDPLVLLDRKGNLVLKESQA
jgi:hypothetical protein